VDMVVWSRLELFLDFRLLMNGVVIDRDQAADVRTIGSLASLC